MPKSFKKSLFIFRRDLRLYDNTGLIQALKNSESVLPCFIFDPRQIRKHDYQSLPGLQFMLESLEDLNNQLSRQQARLYFFEGIPSDIVKNLITNEEIDAVFVNQDYTPFSRKRDQALTDVCVERNVSFHQNHDVCLNSPDSVQKSDGSMYTVFTPYRRNAMTIDVRNPVANYFRNYHVKSVSGMFSGDIKLFIKNYNAHAAVKGGRENALKILKRMSVFKNYSDERDIPSCQGTTHLSAHNKFGTCSIREVFIAARDAFGLEHALINELYWRDFFTHIGYHFPYVLKGAFKRKYDVIPWENDTIKFNTWCEGKTGFPIVDAGMRELNATGFMHNRIRMVTASFLVKDLRIDYKWGERYFAQKLVDYDPLVNNGNWQWAASTGCDAQPYFRIFNPWRQQERFDPECIYIKKWVPELKEISPAQIHKLDRNQVQIKDYPLPIVDHKIQAVETLGIFQAIQQRG